MLSAMDQHVVTAGSSQPVTFSRELFRMLRSLPQQFVSAGSMHWFEIAALSVHVGFLDGLFLRIAR